MPGARCYVRQVSSISPSILAPEQANAVWERFKRQRLSDGDVQSWEPLPDAATIQAVVNKLFWASLHHEEGRAHRLSVALVPPESTVQPVAFERNLPFIPRVLGRLGPAVENSGIHLAAWGGNAGLYVWGIASGLPALSFVVETVKPGLLVIKYSRSGTVGKFGNVAVLEGERFKLANEDLGLRPDSPPMVRRLVRPDLAQDRDDGPDVMIRLAVAMRAHGNGGMLLVVPSGTGGWQQSLAWPSAYSLRPHFSRLAEHLRNPPEETARWRWAADLQRAVADVAGLTAIDGAVVMTEDFEVLGFGVMVERATDRVPVERIVTSEPFDGGDEEVVVPASIGNSRHLAAAQFIHDQRRGMALVASQDGPFTVFTYSTANQLVHADRIDGLLL